MSNSYEKFLVNYHRYTTTARSVDEAFKTADYATALWKCETDSERTWRLAKDLSVVVAAILIIASPLLFWYLS